MNGDEEETCGGWREGSALSSRGGDEGGDVESKEGTEGTGRGLGRRGEKLGG